MDLADLPLGDSPQAPATPHFPTRQQAVIWRNWEMVPPERLARVLGTGRAEVLALARAMGLRTPPRICRDWLTSGYCTIIRDNWHLLPYAQLLALLGWTAERLEYTLREDDFLWIKLGRSKPAVEPVYHVPLTADERARTRQLRADFRAALPATRRRGEAPFAFMQAWEKSSRRPPPSRTYDPAAPLRLAYSYTAPCGDILLHPGREAYPDGLLARYAGMGVNAIWLHGILYSLYPWAAFPELSTGWQTRMANLRRLVKRAARYGIGVYLYLNEPRGLPLAAFKDRPDLAGSTFPDSAPIGLCTANPEIQSFLREGCAHVFSQVPGLAGVFTITMSENPTNCFSRPSPVRECPHCAQQGAAEVIAGVNRLIAEGVHAAAPQARVIAWTWGWKPEWELAAIDRLPPSVDVMCVSEWGLPTNIGGISGSVIDYSISQVGPSERSLRLWRHAQARGLRTVAKVQLNNSWENSAVPWIPVPDLVERHLGRLGAAGVHDVMVGWTVGGYPGGNLALLDHTAGDLAVRDFGAVAPLVRQAWRAFSDAFTALPFSCATIYNSPLNVGPANLLHSTPSGLKASMVTGFPFDDLTSWRAIYPEAVFEAQLRKLCTGWQRGLALLERASRGVSASNRRRFDELDRLARAADCHFRSTWLQVRFIRARDQLAPGIARTRIMRGIVRDEQRLAGILHHLVGQDSRLGFEAANHYNYSRNGLAEKIVQCAWLQRSLSDKAR